MSKSRPFTAGKPRRQGVVFQPTAHQGIQRGINKLVAAIRPTLGPIARTVAINHLLESETTPEILDNGGIIARRIIEITDKDEDMGAMLARALVCRQHDLVGDGTATTAVVFQAIYDGGVRYLASGGNAMRLRYHFEKAVPAILDTLDQMTFFVEGKEKLANLAEAICHDPPLAQLLGEIFDIIGEYGQLDVGKDHGRELRREYLEGMHWNSGLFSRELLINPTEYQNQFENAAVLVIDFQVLDPRDFMPVLELAVESRIQSLVIIAGEIAENAIAGLLLANEKLENFQVMAVKLPGLNHEDGMAAVEDLAILTGAIPLLKITQDRLDKATYENFGWARRVWANPHNFGLIGGKGNPRKLRQHISNLESRFQRAEDPKQREKLQIRIGKLMGGSATLWIGGSSETEIEFRRTLAKRTANTMRAAVRDGVLPGGGSSLLACRALLEEKIAASSEADERAAYHILHAALAEPARTIFKNAGFDPSEVLAKLTHAENNCGFNVLTKEVVDMGEAGIVDCASSIKMAVRNAITTAALALTIDVLVHHKQPEIVTEPG